jgi:hypothetical protein
MQRTLVIVSNSSDEDESWTSSDSDDGYWSSSEHRRPSYTIERHPTQPTRNVRIATKGLSYRPVNEGALVTAVAVRHTHTRQEPSNPRAHGAWTPTTITTLISGGHDHNLARAALNTGPGGRYVLHS